MATSVPELRPVLTVRDFIALTGLSRNLIYSQLADGGSLAHLRLRVGRRVLLSGEKVRAWLSNGGGA